MRSLEGPIWDLWNNGGPFVGTHRSHGRVTVEFGWELRESTGPVGDRPAEKLPVRFFQLADNSQTETELPRCKNIQISRSIDTDAATCNIDVHNTEMLQGLLDELGSPGYYTFGRGSHPDAVARWGHEANEWTDRLVPNALIRTYEGFGGWNDDGSPMDIVDCLDAGYLVQTGVWLVDDVRPETPDNLLKLMMRDPGKLLIEQPLFPPLVPQGLYPLHYARFYHRFILTPSIAYGTAADGVKIINGIITDAGNDGYWLVGDDGGVFTYGNNYFHGSLSGDVDHGIIGGARSFGTEGYWIAAEDGTVFAFGDATWYMGDPPAAGELMVAIEGLINADGFYLCDTAGHVYSYGDADYHGGGAGTSPICAMACTPDGSGYWLLDDTGHVYNYGAAPYYGAPDYFGVPFTAIEATPTGLGYYLVTKMGHVYAYGDAVYHGGTESITLNDPISDIGVRPDGAGYWLVAEDGGVFTFGPISFYGSLPGTFGVDFPYDGNYFDYADIVKDIALWAGYWNNDGGAEDKVFGNIEYTGAYGPYDLPDSMFDKQSPLQVMTAIKEIVGYVIWIDSIGALHFESPNWWNEGNFLPDGTHTTQLPQIDERQNLITYGVSHSDKTARDRVIISNVDPTIRQPEDVVGRVTTTVVPEVASLLKGILNPALWTHHLMSDPEDQQTMADLLAKQLLYQTRVGSSTCWANPLIEVNDQVRLWERQTEEVYDHYVRGVETTHDLETGEYTMQLTHHWLGRDWAGPGPTRRVFAQPANRGETFGEFTVDGGDPPAPAPSLTLPSYGTMPSPDTLPQ